MIMETKYIRSGNVALKQIEKNRYIGALAGYHGKVLLICIGFSAATRKHPCRIEETTL